MKVKYIGIIIKTVNYDVGKYLYLIPKEEYTLTQNEFNTERIQKMINETHELRVIEESRNIGKQYIQKTQSKVIKNMEKEIDKVIKKDKKKSKRKKKKRKSNKLKNVLDSLKNKDRGGK